MKLKNKAKYTVFPSEDPRSHILYNEIDLFNYLVLLEDEIVGIEELIDKELWTLEFYASCASVGSEVRVVLITPSCKIIPKAFKLNFENTNNTIEYEPLLLGIEEAKRRGVKILRAKGDVELVVKKVRDIFTIKNPRLKYYRNRVWDKLKFFEVFSIESIPKEYNAKAYVLAGSTSS